jgi:hypothetical protein
MVRSYKYNIKSKSNNFIWVAILEGWIMWIVNAHIVYSTYTAELLRCIRIRRDNVLSKALPRRLVFTLQCPTNGVC